MKEKNFISLSFIVAVLLLLTPSFDLIQGYDWRTKTVIAFHENSPDNTVLIDTLSFTCIEFNFSSNQQQADSIADFLSALKNPMSNSSKVMLEQKLFCAFPNNFEEMEALFGFDPTNKAGPLYSTSEHSQNYLYKNISNDAIGYFNELLSIPNEIYYQKSIRICIDGIWAADNIQDGFGLRSRILEFPDVACNELSKFSDYELKSVFRFFFDGPHPNHDLNREEMIELRSELAKRSKRLSKLVTDAFEELIKENEPHGH